MATRITITMTYVDAEATFHNDEYPEDYTMRVSCTDDGWTLTDDSDADDVTHPTRLQALYEFAAAVALQIKLEADRIEGNA